MEGWVMVKIILSNVIAHPRGEEEPEKQTECFPASDAAACSALAFGGVVSAIDDLLSLLIQCEVKGYKVHGKSIMETATWERAISLLQDAELLSGKRGEILSSKMKKGAS
jgi:hypothetical protein